MPKTVAEIQAEIEKKLAAAKEKKLSTQIRDIEDCLTQIKLCDRTIKRHPDDDNAYFLKSQAFIKLTQATGDRLFNEPALLEFNHANELSPNNPYYLANRAKLYAEMGEYQLAQADLDVLRALPQDEDIQIKYFVIDTIKDLEKMLSAQAKVSVSSAPDSFFSEPKIKPADIDVGKSDDKEDKPQFDPFN